MTQTIEDAVRIMNEEKYEEAISIAQSLENDTDIEISETAMKIIGLAYFQLNRFDEAETTFKKLCEKSTLPSDWFSLCTSATMNNNIILGREAYDKAIYLHTHSEQKSGRHVSMMEFFYMQALMDMKKYEEAFSILNDLKVHYTMSGITDPTYLFNMYGAPLPYFAEVINRAVPIFVYLGKEKSSTWLKDLALKVDEGGKKEIELVLKKIV